jgi:hypothetical protein
MFVYVARVDRMREAKTEAESIIAAYRAEMEANYQKNLAQVIRPSPETTHIIPCSRRPTNLLYSLALR